MSAVELYVVRRMRPRPYQTHIANQDTPELRQFVEAVTAEESSDTGDTRVVRDLEERAIALVERSQVILCGVSLRNHRPKLVTDEPASLSSHARRAVKRRTGRIEFDDGSDQQQQWQ